MLRESNFIICFENCERISCDTGQKKQLRNELSTGKDVSVMKINASTVSMASARSYQKTEAVSILSASTKVKAGSNTQSAQAGSGAWLNLSDGGLSKMQDLREKLKMLDRDATAERAQGENKYAPGRASDGELEIMKRMLEILKKTLKQRKGEAYQEETPETKLLLPSDLNSGRAINVGSAAPGSGTVFERTVVTSSFFSEQEVTCFSATGIVQTADGRSLDFRVDLEMSRSFMEETIITDTTEQIFCDPLVINLDAKGATVTDQKFFFDLDADGTEESISFVGEGSGFLALDKNGDGEINDGTELFGTKSGDGFADLAAFDADKNGWIDENDEVFNRLKVWTKDADGNNKLVDLKQADVGAIFLGKVGTEFSLNSLEDNQTNGMIRSTGVYLKESSGAAFTVQHVDLAL